MSKQRWTEQRGREVVREWRRSGQSMSAFAREHGWNVQRMAYWRDRVEGQEAVGVKEASARFLPAMIVSGTGRPASSARTRVVLPNGVSLEVEQVDELSVDWIAALAFALGEPS